MRLFFRKKKQSRCTAVIVAAGSASRMEGTDKIFAELSGVPVLVRTLLAFQNSGSIADIVVVVREGMLTKTAELCSEYGITKVIKVTAGGASRLESVSNGLRAVPGNSTLIAVHDGARPLVSEAVISDAVRLAGEKHAAEPAVPVKDTVKVVEKGVVSDTPDRKTLFAVQTPQVFQADLLRGAIRNAVEKHLEITDDAMAVEAIGGVVWISRGEYRNLKITTPEDLLLAEALLREEKADI